MHILGAIASSNVPRIYTHASTGRGVPVAYGAPADPLSFRLDE